MHTDNTATAPACATCGTSLDLHRDGIRDIRCHACRLDDDLRAHGYNIPTPEQHDAADAALINIMARKITGTEWGGELIDAALSECVYASWILALSTGSTRSGGIQAARIEHENVHDVIPPILTTTITRDDIARAIAEIWNGQHGNGYVAEYVRDAINEHDAGHIDADAADAIIQVATLGDIVYG